MTRESRRLSVWLGTTKIAELEQRKRPEIRCHYTEVALETWPLNSPIISCSLPLTAEPQNALAFCKGLLPEGQALRALAARAKVPVNYTFDLLERYGRDIAGALVISSDAPQPRRFGVEPYEAEGLAEAIGELDEHPLGVHDDSELSLAGLQDKLLLVELGDNSWGRPLHGRPSTHILKIEDRRFPGMAKAEAACLQLARSLGLTTINCSVETVDSTPCLIVSRFDRRAHGGEVQRIHQEDLCQALGLDPEGPKGRGKYETGGGPTLQQAARLLDAWASNPAEQLDRLLAATTFTAAIGNADAHGKNLGLLHPEPDEISLAPLYDTVPTAAWAKLRSAAAMSIGGELDLAKVAAQNLLDEADSWNMPRDRANSMIEDTLNSITQALDSGSVDAEESLAEMIYKRVERIAP